MIGNEATHKPLKITEAGIQFDQLQTDLGELSIEDIEAELKAFEDSERARLGLEEEVVEQWVDHNPQAWKRSQRESTTLLTGGLTHAQDIFISAAVKGLGYKVQPLDVPDNAAFHIGKEFGNRGQCNPTYFTVGNLIKHLIRLRDEDGLTTQEVVDGYVFFTAGACGPCRFGMYVTEYRKALRDAGFENFRVMLFQQQGGLKQATGEESALELNPAFFIGLLKAIMAGDVLNAIGYRMRPYEVVPGATDAAIQKCKDLLVHAFENRKSVLWALVRCRLELRKVEIDRLQPKPKVSIIGEFWAMTTEGDGNYRLQSFLESEGAEVDVQLVTNWLMYNIWQVRTDTKRRMTLRGTDGGKFGLEGSDVRKRLVLLWAAERALKGVFYTFAAIMGLEKYHLTDMTGLAEISTKYYRKELKGGEGHMEVGKLIQSVEKKKAHMVVSVKPFGCMPSSAVSDGVQSLITKQYPEAIFCPIETSGDGAVNVQSRVQMFLFKARKKARAEFQKTLDERGLSVDQAKAKLSRNWKRALHYPKHVVAGTGANVLESL